MYIETKNGYTCLTAQEGRILSNERIGVIAKEVYISQSMGTNDWKEVSEFVLLTPQEQQQHLDELENKVADFENKWNDAEALQARVDELGKVIPSDEPNGDYLSPFRYVEGMEVIEGKWYAVDDPNNPDEPFVWEAIKSGIPANGQDTEYFDIAQ